MIGRLVAWLDRWCDRHDPFRKLKRTTTMNLLRKLRCLICSRRSIQTIATADGRKWRLYGDGRVDNTRTLQLALDADRSVAVPPGIYRTTRPFTLPEES